MLSLRLTLLVICHCLQIDTCVIRGSWLRVCFISFPVLVIQCLGSFIRVLLEELGHKPDKGKEPLNIIILAVPTIYTVLLFLKALSIYCCTLTSLYTCEEEPRAWGRHLSSAGLVSVSSSPSLEVGSTRTHCFDSSFQLLELPPFWYNLAPPSFPWMGCLPSLVFINRGACSSVWPSCLSPSISWRAFYMKATRLENKLAEAGLLTQRARSPQLQEGMEKGWWGGKDEITSGQHESHWNLRFFFPLYQIYPPSHSGFHRLHQHLLLPCIMCLPLF